METRDFGRLGQVSALTLGGGGIAGVWGSTDRAEAVATIRAAVDAGITMLDLAPAYGVDAESEQAAGEALRGYPADVMITTKVQLPDDTERDFEGRIRRSLAASLARIGRDHLDLFLLHTQLRPRDGSPSGTNHIGWDNYRNEVLPVFERLVAEGSIRGWGITAVGHPDSVLDALREAPRPYAAQIVVNALDMPGDLWGFDAAPQNAAVRETAVENGVAVIGIRAVAAGSLTSSLDRSVPDDHPAAADFARAEPFRKLAASFGETPAMLAHRYALSVPGVATVVLGVKNRAELAECLEASSKGPLTADEMALVNPGRR
jgi:aryl-alcohol dehydrogenase-like predicted oxidoreductase